MAGEENDLSLTAQVKKPCDLVVIIQDSLLIFILIKNYISLSFDIFVHILVDIEVVGREVGHDRYVGALAHGNELERGQLHHADVGLFDGLDLGQERLADVAADMYGVALRFQHFADHGGSGGLAVGACHRVDLARTDIEEYLHLGADDNAFVAQGVQLVAVEAHTGRSQGDIHVEVVEITLAERQLSAVRLRLLSDLSERFFVALVAGDDLRAVFRKQRDQRHMTAAHADQRDSLAVDGSKK